METPDARALPSWKQKAYSIIFESDTPAGRSFDIALLWAILLSVVVVMLESVRSINAQYGPYLRVVEWVFTGAFMLEYLARLIVVRRPLTYALSLLGIIDFMALAPTLISLLVAGSQYLLVIRTLRLLRVFRIFKLGHFVGEGEFIVRALKASRFKILVFLTAVLTLVVVIGTLMYVVEGGKNGFTSIPKSIYWAIVTLTTVGYGDISPVTVLGQTLASVLMILGYAIIAVPTGIVSAQMASPQSTPPTYKQVICHVCQATEHRPEAEFCWRCGEKL
ncbi:voltage-gated potassium channel [Hymenobacter luteus]|uniref:Voltage-gated potassium channel n=2 Tax=Hymenobacter TaxID=89966 RepID=A0A7W9T3W1_9BACT|nr:MULTISPECIES: ion transporter [Hymenobacter]MBB4602544.1 voltage-gated potassium channel [Hymenobacter latericoloratus]MBB6060435.1 voltage-gated potassium channel [Hymenobacter luteus]